VLHLLDFGSTSVLPENPERLTRIAEWMGMSGGNDVLAMVGAHRESVTRIFSEVIQEA
jgi:glutamine synthetase adenylyltransferase